MIGSIHWLRALGKLSLEYGLCFVDFPFKHVRCVLSSTDTITHCLYFFALQLLFVLFLFLSNDDVISAYIIRFIFIFLSYFIKISALPCSSQHGSYKININLLIMILFRMNSIEHCISFWMTRNSFPLKVSVELIECINHHKSIFCIVFFMIA